MLAVVSDNHFMGVVGTPSGTVVNGVEVCVGDVVRVVKGSNHHASKGVVAIFGNKLSVMGLAGSPLSYYTVEEIVQSHKELTDGSELQNGYFKVKELLK